MGESINLAYNKAYSYHNITYKSNSCKMSIKRAVSLNIDATLTIPNLFVLGEGGGATSNFVEF